MSNELTSAEMADALGTLAQLVNEKVTNLSDLTSTVYAKAATPGNEAVKFHEYGKVAVATQVAQGSAAGYLGSSAPSLIRTLTIGDPYLAAEFVPNTVELLAPGTMNFLAGRLAQSIIKTRNQAILNVLIAFAPTFISAGTGLAEADLIKARRKLVEAGIDVSGEPLFAAMSPVVGEGLKQTYTSNPNITNAAFRDQVIGAGRLPGQVAGINLVEVTSGFNFAGTGAYTADEFCFVYNPKSVLFATASNGNEIRYNIQQSALKDGWDVVAACNFTVGEGVADAAVRIAVK
jgi:hypothetical protein